MKLITCTKYLSRIPPNYDIPVPSYLDICTHPRAMAMLLRREQATSAPTLISPTESLMMKYGMYVTKKMIPAAAAPELPANNNNY